MVALRPLDPAPSVPCGSLNLVAPEAARTAVGIVAMIYATENSEVRSARLVQMANPADREQFAGSVADDDPAIAGLVQGLLTLLPAIDVALRKIEASKSKGSQPGSSAQSAPTTQSRTVVQVNNRFMREISDDCWKVIGDYNDATDAPTVYERGGALVRLRVADDGTSAEHFLPPALKGLLDRAADFVRVVETNAGEVHIPSRPPDDVVRDLLALPTLPVPPLRSIASGPVVLPAGRILVDEGYDRSSGIYLAPSGLHDLRADLPLDEARALLLEELLGDFPFADGGSLAHTVALCLERFVREVIAATSPLYLIEAPAQGTGKGLLSEICAIVALGEAPWVMAEPGDEAEMRKRITSLLLEGRQMVLLDNVYSIKSGVFAAALTTTTWEDRLLGVNKTVRVRNTASWVATGNNVALSTEIVRRVAPIRLDAEVERPEARTDFKHPDLPTWTRDHRSELVSACLSLIQAWISAGQPRGTATLGRFERWAQILGGILDVAGIPGFLTNRDRLYSVSDAENTEWITVCDLWAEQFGQNPITAKDLLALVQDRNLLVDLRAGRNKLSAQQRTGHALRTRVDRVFGAWRIRAAGTDSSTGNAAYRLEPHKGPGQSPTTMPENAGSGVAAPVTPGVSGVSGVSDSAAQDTESPQRETQAEQSSSDQERF